MSKKLSIRLNSSRRRRKLLLPETLSKKLPLKSRRSLCPRKHFSKIGRNLSLVCSKEIRLSKPSKSLSSKRMMKFSRLRVRSLVFVTRPEESRRSLRDFTRSLRNARLNRTSLSNARMKSRLIRNVFRNSILCLRPLFNQPRMNLSVWTLKRPMLTKRCRS